MQILSSMGPWVMLSYLDKIIMLDKVEYSGKQKIYGVRKWSWKKEFQHSFGKRSNPGAQISGSIKTDTAEIQIRERQEVKARGVHLGSGPPSTYFRKSPGSLCWSQNIHYPAEMPGHYVQKQKLQSRREGGQNEQIREKKLARKKYKELRNMIGNEILLGKGENTTPGVTHAENREGQLPQRCRPAPIWAASGSS